MRIALGIEYYGGSYCGWQTQPSGCAIQDHVERALEKFATNRISTVTAGRTDTGVHALTQVVHFDTRIEREEASWVRGTNANLDADIRVLWAKRVADDFHARFCARSRTYDYFLLNDSVDAGLWKGRVGWFHAPLNTGAMQEAAGAILGEHDFTAFRASECQAASPLRIVTRADITSKGKILCFRFTANAFLHHMVRNLVGSLVYIGSGRKPPGWIAELLLARDRSLAAPTFAPDGLYLAAIEYDRQWGLPEFPQRYPFMDLQ
jgi:tRNA pseudouridine38-40 synthase